MALREQISLPSSACLGAISYYSLIIHKPLFYKNKGRFLIHSTNLSTYSNPN